MSSKVVTAREGYSAWARETIGTLEGVRAALWPVVQPLGTVYTKGAFYFLVPVPERVSRHAFYVYLCLFVLYRYQLLRSNMLLWRQPMHNCCSLKPVGPFFSVLLSCFFGAVIVICQLYCTVFAYYVGDRRRSSARSGHPVRCAADARYALWCAQPYASVLRQHPAVGRARCH